MKNSTELYEMFTTKNEEIATMFNNVNVYSGKYQIIDEVQVSGDRIRVSIKESINRWSSEIVYLDFTINYKNSVNITYNYGSGGWIDTDITDQMNIMSEAFAGAKHMVDFMRANETIIVEKLKESSDIYSDFYDTREAENRIEKATKNAIIQEEINEITKKFKRISNIDNLMNVVKKYDDGGYGKVLMFKPSFDNKTISIIKVDIEWNKDSKLTFKFDGSRTSKATMESIIEQGMYVIDETNKNILGNEYSISKNLSKDEILKNISK